MPTFDHAFDWARRHVDDGRLPTAVLGIATADGVVALDAFGEASADDHYPLFSITKPIVGLAALSLIEEGRLAQDAPLTVAIPQFGADREDLVRLRHLASHTSGIVEPPMDAPGLRGLLLAPGRDFAAGTVSRYSTIGFEGIAALIEQASGAPWQRAVAEVGERADAPGLTFDFEASRHDPIDAAERGLDWDRMKRLRHPGAGLFARATDLLALGSALLRDDGSVVSPITVEAMRRPLTTGLPKLEPYVAERGQDWGFAWNLRTRAPGLIDRDVYGHAGWGGTEFWVHPSAGVAWVLLTNIAPPQDVDPDELDNAVVSGI